jgi:hypoxanthine phosphoribosyltransferase
VTASSATDPNSGRRRRRRSSSRRRRSEPAAIGVAAPAPIGAVAAPATRGDPVDPTVLAERNVPSGAWAPEAAEEPEPWPRADRPEPTFAHASEAEMARILDFYRVRWEYEPHTFPILWNLDGAVVESFAPDFWLPDLGLYLEMTTLRQKLVRKKNRKLRRVLELYPDLRVKLFYARDFRALMLKFGRLALVEELSGASGHLGPDRGPDGGDALSSVAAASADSADDDTPREIA